MKKLRQFYKFHWSFYEPEQVTLDKCYAWVQANEGHLLAEAWGTVPSTMWEIDGRVIVKHVRSLGYSMPEDPRKQKQKAQRYWNEAFVIRQIKNAAFTYRAVVVLAILRQIRRES